MSLNIFFCVTCKGRTNHLRKTLPRNLADNPSSKFVLLDYGDEGELAEYVRQDHLPDIHSGQLIYYRYDTTSPFRMSHAKNIAHRLAIVEGADVLINMDADNYSIPGFDKYVANLLVEPEQTYLCCNAKSIVGRARQGLAGRIIISRNTFLKTGGYDERYVHWAPEDEDFKQRIQRIGLKPIMMNEEYLWVIPHKDGLRFKEYPHAKPTPQQEAASIQKIRDSDDVIANYGNSGCGTVFRNFGCVPINLNPFPTRIFGIGMHKTATASLHEALSILGFESAHWTGPWWAKAVYDKMTTVGRSPMIERVYAASDLPITMLYKELDKSYPGSKFILTIRNENEWINSVRNHFESNKSKYDWDKDCFSHRCHNLLYGRKTFDYNTMINRYRQHNDEVKKYFKSRPNDLLVLDSGDWVQLCRFLGCPIPNTKYPYINRS